MKLVDEGLAVTPSRTGAGAFVLVVDDEPGVRRFATRALEREGYSVLQAGDGTEALELLSSRNGAIEVVVSDIVMPRMNGVELMQSLATSHPHLPVILMSGYATTALSELGIAAPCSVLSKPFTAERLLEEVQRCIRRPGG
jgi:two-component system, cell cycle sensor histidine kinase and response regulator CckA